MDVVSYRIFIAEFEKHIINLTYYGQTPMYF